MNNKHIKSCPFCSKGFRINCSGAYEHDSEGCILHGFEICNEKDLEKWNMRIPMDNVLTELKKQENEYEDALSDFEHSGTSAEKSTKIKRSMIRKFIKMIEKVGDLND